MHAGNLDVRLPPPRFAYQRPPGEHRGQPDGHLNGGDAFSVTSLPFPAPEPLYSMAAASGRAASGNLFTISGALPLCHSRSSQNHRHSKQLFLEAPIAGRKRIAVHKREVRTQVTVAMNCAVSRNEQLSELQTFSFCGAGSNRIIALKTSHL